MKITKPFAIIEAATEDMEEVIEAAGRTCWKSEDKIEPGTAEPFIERLKNLKHESVLEHAAITVRFVVDRGVSHEIVRHRIASYSQESTRYCNYGKGKFGEEITVIDPRGGFPEMTDNAFAA
jgi:thymidylate synthase (FAD)